jgi:hypothetical protein
MESTYDPIVGGPEQLPFFQLRSLASPRLGVALVLVSAKGELVTSAAGSPAPPGRFGNYRSVYYIDTAEHQLFLDAQLPSADPGFVFQAHLTYRCRVADPAEVARRQIHDIGELVRPQLTAAMRAATRRLDIGESARAEEAIENALLEIACDPAVEVSQCQAELPVHADEAASSARSYRETRRSTRLTGMRVGPMRELLAGGSPDLLALHLANHPEDTGPIMEMLVAGDIAEAQNMLQAIGIMYGRPGAEEEPFETREERKQLMDRFLTRALPTGSLYGGRGAARGEGRPGGGSRLRGSLARPAGRDPLMIEGEVVGEAESSDAHPPTARAKPSPPRDPDLDEEP